MISDILETINHTSGSSILEELVKEELIEYLDKIEDYIKKREDEELEFLEDLITQNTMVMNEMIEERISDLNQNK